MEQQRKVQTIPATLTRFTATPLSAQKKRKVAGYARVSTDHDDQFTSYEAQIDYYTNYIKGRDDWEFVSVYTDEGITGTSTKHREGFKRMIADALDGKIDLIVTKSVSRFARNTVDSLTTIRQLKENGIEVYFEKENIWTFDSKGELLLTIMSSLAQEEARSISENTTWGQRKRFADGKVSVPYSRFLGYEKGPDGTMVIVPEQAETIRLIYRLFLEGSTFYSIAKELDKRGIKTPGGKDHWTQTTVRGILTNEKYKGDALIQKRFTVDFLTKKQKINEGEVPQYYVENNHEAIIDPAMFDLAQIEFEKRLKSKRRYSGVSLFSSKVQCAECGGWYGSKIWHSTDQYRKVVYRCNHKYNKKHTCTTPHLTEQEIKDIAVKAINKIITEKEAFLENIEIIKQTLNNEEALKNRQSEVATEMEITVGLTHDIIRDNARRAQDQTEYEKRYNALVAKYEALREEYESIDEQIQNETYTRQTLDNMGNAIRKSDLLDEVLWNTMVDFIRVKSKEEITVVLKDGTELRV